jgi:small-conductance mechanosensitive channel
MFEIPGSVYSSLTYVSITFGIAAVIFLSGIMLGNFLGKISKKIIRKMNLNGNLRKALGLKFKPEILVAKIVKYVVMGIASIAALIQIGIAISIMKFLLIIFGGILLISFTLALRDFLPNMFAGLYIISTKKIKVGDKIRFKEFDGSIKKVELLNTYLKMDSKNTMMIPNSFLIKNWIIKVETDRKRKVK